MNKKFYVNGGGDSSVGIADVDAVITIDDNFEGEMNEEDIRNIKEFLAEFYDVKVNNVSTEEEVKAENDYQEKIYQEINEDGTL